MTTIITRFAPSPTGYLHIGGARTALFNWLFARHYGGKFLLRIEDTDRARSTQGAIDAILDGMHWLGLNWDNEPIFQFARAERHAEVARQLVEEGKAYRCYATQEELEAFRAEHPNEKFRSPWREGGKPATDLPYVIRLKAPLEGEVMVDDIVRGDVRVGAKELDDMVLLRSDGTPTYMLAVVVDDHDMSVTHVIRGDDHFTNTFRQTLLYDAMDWRVPIFAHVPMILGEDGAKLSKRHGALGVDAYREMGYLPEAICNYLLRLGWSHGDDEIISTAQAIAWFNPEKIGHAPARFDFTKLESVNAHYIKEAEDTKLIDLISHSLTSHQGPRSSAILMRAIPQLKQRAKTIVELRDAVQIYLARPPLDSKAEEVLATGKTVLSELLHVLEGLSDWNAPLLDSAIKAFTTEKGIKFPAIGQPLRAALTGTPQGVSVSEIMSILGRDESLERIRLVC